MPDHFAQTLTTLSVIAAIVVIAIILIAVGASGTSIGRALLPRSITDAVSKLLPYGRITDAAANSTGEFQVEVTATGSPRTAYVRRSGGMTIAWTYDPGADFPASGTFALVGFQHNLKPDSPVAPEKLRARVQKSLTEVLGSKHFRPAGAETADIRISVFVAVEDEVTLDTVSQAFDEPDGHAWATALRTALEHESVGEVATFARGSIVLDVVESRPAKVLWHAVAVADVVIDVSESQRERRIRKAITEMLRQFPPK